MRKLHAYWTARAVREYQYRTFLTSLDFFSSIIMIDDYDLRLWLCVIHFYCDYDVAICIFLSEFSEKINPLSTIINVIAYFVWFNQAIWYDRESSSKFQFHVLMVRRELGLVLGKMDMSEKSPVCWDSWTSGNVHEIAPRCHIFPYI